MSGHTRRAVLKAGSGLALAAGLGMPRALAAAYPSKPFTMYIPGKPGGGFDRASRAFAPAFERLSGQPFKVDFAPGAGITLAATKMLSAPPEGYSLFYTALSTMGVAIEGTPKAGFGHDSFAPVGTVYGGPLAMFARKDSRFQTFEEVVEASKTSNVTGAMDNARQFYHVGGLIVNRRTGARISYVPYGGGGPSRRAAAAGETDVVMTGFFDAASMFDQLRCLCIFADRNPLPERVSAPTMREVYGDKAVNLLHPNGLTTSAAFRAERPDDYARLVDTFKTAITADNTRKAMIAAGFPPEALIYWSPDDIDDWYRSFVAEVRTISF